jgi:O-antigen/teichoic acid export membrane protein
MANPIKSLIGQTAIYGVSSILGRFINYLLVPFYSYIFLSHEYGVVAELTAYVTILQVLLTYGMETAFFRFSKNDSYDPNSVYKTSLVSIGFTSVLFILIIVFLGGKIADLIDYRENPEFIILLGITVGLDAFSNIPFARLRILNKARRFAFIKLANIFTNVFFNLFFLYFLPSFFGEKTLIYRIFYPEVHVGYIFISFLLSSVITLILLKTEIYEGFKNSDFKKDVLTGMLKYALPVLLAGLAGMFSETLDRILLKYLIVVPEQYMENILLSGGNISLEEKNYVMGQIGIYGANVKIAVIMTLFLQAFRYAAEPFFFSYSKNDNSRLIYARVMKYFIAFSLFIFLGVTLFIDIVKFLIGPDYRSGLVVVPLLLLSKIFIGIIFNLSIWYKLKNLTIYGAWIAIVGATGSIGLNILLIPYFGFIGSAWASVFSYFIMMLVAFVLEKRNFNIPYDYFSIGLYFISALLIFIFNLFIRSQTEYYMVFNILFILLYIFIFSRIEKINIITVFLNLIKR